MNTCERCGTEFPVKPSQVNRRFCSYPCSTTHHGTGTRLHHIWIGMRSRCFSPSDPRYPNYGGRGITLCPEWDDFVAFRAWSVEHGYRDSLSIDRIDNDGPYAPDNCRWATAFDQLNNRRTTHRIAAFEEEKTVSQWTQDTRCLVCANTILSRMRRGWDAERAMTTPPGRENGERSSPQGSRS